MNEHSQEDVRARLFLQQYLSYTAVSLGVAYTPFQSLSPQLTTPCRVLPDFEPSGLASLPIWDLVSRKKRIAFPAIKPHLFHTRTIEQAVKQIVIRQVNGAPIAEGQASLLTLFIPTLETAIAPFIEDSHSDSGWQSIAIRTQVIAINFLLKPINGRSRFLRGKSKPDPTSKTQAHQVISDLYTRLSSILTLIASEKIFLSPTFPAAIPALQQLSQTVMTLSFYATQLDALSTQLTGTTPRPTTDLAALKTWRAIYGAIKIDANMDKERVKHLVTVQKHCRQVIEALKRHDHQQHLTCLLTLSQVPSTKSIQGKLNRFVMQQLRTGPWEDAAELIADMLATAIEEAYTLIQTQLRSQTKIPKQLRQLDHHYRDTRVLLALLLIALDNQQRLLPARFLHSFLSRRSEHSYTVVVLQFFATCLDEPVFHALLEDSMSLGTDSERDAMIHTLNLAANPYDEDSTIVNTTGPEEPNTWWNSPQACHAWHARFKRLMIAMPTAWWAQTLPYFSTESLLNSALLDSMLTSYTTISKEQDILNATILSLSQTADGTSRYAFLSQEKLRIFAILFHTHQLHHDCLQPYLLERDLFTKTLKAKLDLIQARYDQPQLLFPKAWFAYQIRHCIAFLFEALQTQPGYFLQSALTSNLVRQLANIVSIGLESGATESLHSLYILDLVCDTDTFQQHVHEVLLNKSDTQLHTAYTNYIAKYPPIGTSLSGACLAADFTLTLLHRFQGAFSEPVLGRAGFGLRVAILNFFSEQKTTLTKHLPESLRHDFLSCLSLVSKKNTGTSLSKLSAFSTQVSAPHLNQDTQALGEFLYYLLQLCHTPSEATLPAPILPLLLKRGFSTPLFQHIHPRLTHAVLHPTPHWDSLASLLHYVEQLSTDLPQADMHAFLTNLLPELLSAQTHSEHAQTISTVLHQLLKLVLTYLNNTDNDTSRLDILRKTATLTTHSLKKGIMTPDTPHIEELTALLQPIEAAHPLVSFLENNALAFEAVDAILDGKPITVTHERAIQHLLLNHDRLSTLASLSPKRYLQLLAGLLLFAQSPSTQHGQLNPESVALIFKTRFPETLEPKATLSQFLQLYLKPILSYSDYQVLMTLFYDNFSAPQQRDLLDMIHTDRPCFSRFFLQECDTFASPVEQWTRRHHTLTDHIDALTTTLEKTDDPALFDAIEHAVQLRSQLGCLETEASAAIVRQGRKLYDAVRTNQDVDQALLPLRTCLSPILSQEIPTSSSLHALFAISRDLHRYCERQRAISADKEAAGRAMWDGLNETMQDCLKATLYVIVFFPIPTCDTQLNSFFLLLEERAPDSEKILQDIFESPQFGHDEKRAFLLLMTRLDRLHRERLIVWLAHHMGGIASLSDDVLLSLCEHLYFANLSAKAIVALCDSVERVQELIPLLFSRNESLALLFAHALPDTEKQSLRLLTLLDGSKSLLSPDFQQFFTALAGPLDKEAPSLLDSETTASETSFRVKWALVACLQRTHSTKQHTTLITFFESLNDQRRYHTYATLFYTLFPRSFIRFLNMCPETLSQALISALLEFENQSPALIASLLAGSKQARSLALAHLTQHPLTFSNQPDLALLPILDLYVSQATTATIPSSHVESLIQYWQEHGQLEKLKQLTAHALETYFLKAAWPLSPNDLGLLSALSTPLLHAVMHKLAQDRPIKELVEHVLAAPSFLRFSPKRKAAQTRLIQDFLLKTTDPVTAATYFPQHQFLFYVAQTVLLTCPKPLPLKHLLDLLNDLRTVPCHWHPAQQEVLLSAFKTESGQKQLRSFSEQTPTAF